MIFALISLIISVFVLMLLLQRSYEDINKLNTELKEINNLQKDLLDKIDKLSEKI
jgi:peptidoglycan hydrolase CwlO-like protein